MKANKDRVRMCRSLPSTGLPGSGLLRFGGALVLYLVIGSEGALAVQSSAKPGSELALADQLLASGKYEEAEKAFEGLSRSNPTPVVYRSWVEALRRLGRYEDAIRQAVKFSESSGSSYLLNALGELYYETGRIEEAREAFEKAIEGRANDFRTAELNLAIWFFDSGEIEEALERFDAFIDVYNQAASLTPVELVAVGRACNYLAVTNPQLLHDALKAFDEAWAQDSGTYDAQVRAGELFLQTYNSPDAQESLSRVVQKDPKYPRALLGLARVASFNGSPDALKITEQLVSDNPNFVDARALKAKLLLGLEQYDDAAAEAKSGLAVNPVSLNALTILAAAEMLKGNDAGFEKAKAAVFARNPRYAEFYNELAEIAVNNRLYEQASEFAENAVRLDERSWRGHGLLGLNQLRLGEVTEARESLERSFGGDPFNVWVKNTLDLMDNFETFRTVKTERFEIFAAEDEVDLLTPYVERIGDEAFDKLSERYGYRPNLPIRVEIYDSHADFSVRTIGLSGLGALGVCFGEVVVVDSPSARGKGDFNWASTLWHELAHTFTLGATDHKVPRWFSEGLSVLEERRARPGWGDDINLPFLIAYQQDKLLPLAEINNGFIRPTHPHQVGVSYYQASLICELIEREFGFQALRQMLDGYRSGKTTEAIIKDILNKDFEAFDEFFTAYLDERFGEISSRVKVADESAPTIDASELADRVADEEDFLAQLKFGESLFREDEFEKALPFLERARDLFPEYGGPDSPHRYLAEIYEKQGELDKAAEHLESFVNINENHYDAHLKLASIMAGSKRFREAAEILSRAVYIYPFDPAPHQELAVLFRDLGELEEVVRERRALVALDRVDPAQTHYDLALAYRESGDLTRARRSVLRALEIAPAFKKGLELLVAIRVAQKKI